MLVRSHITASVTVLSQIMLVTDKHIFETNNDFGMIKRSLNYEVQCIKSEFDVELMKMKNIRVEIVEFI